jgi:hypothetical protein
VKKKADQEERKAGMKANQEEIKTLVSCLDIQQEMMEVTIHSICSEFEETIKYQMKDALSCRSKDAGLRKELIEKTNKHRLI